MKLFDLNEEYGVVLADEFFAVATAEEGENEGTPEVPECDGNHTYNKEEWKTNTTHHWHAATCGHDVKGDYQEHTFDKDGVCTTCEYKTTADPEPKSNPWLIYVVLGVVVVGLIVWFFLSNRKNKTRQKEYVEQLEAIRPGHKVKTAGGICGIVVEVCDDNTVILETGSDASGKSYVKMDKELIAQTDAKGPTQLAREAAEEAKKQGKSSKEFPAKEETPAQTEEQPAEEPSEEDKES